MKALRTTRHERQREPLAPERGDPYRSTAKDPDPATCPRCRATYRAGRWTWSSAPPDSARHTCPSCRRLEDDFPAGFVTLKGPFFAAHRDEILQAVMARAERALREHPLQRIIGMQETRGGVLVTTTDPHLARSIAVAVQSAYKGNLDLSFSAEDHLVRATWSR